LASKGIIFLVSKIIFLKDILKDDGTIRTTQDFNPNLGVRETQYFRQRKCSYENYDALKNMGGTEKDNNFFSKVGESIRNLPLIRATILNHSQ